MKKKVAKLIIENNGLISPLVHKNISADACQEYLKILRNFEESN